MSDEETPLVEVRSPRKDPDLFKISDRGIAEYIELPEDTIFVESVAINTTFEKDVGFMVGQRKINGKPQSFVYKIAPGMTKAEELFGPLATEEGGTHVTIFGCELTSDGLFYLCCFNRNSIIIYDLKNQMPEPGKEALCLLEIPKIPSPNDVCLDPQNERTLYVCGGTFCSCICTTFTNSAYGKIYKVQLNDSLSDATVTVVSEGYDTLAGVEVVKDDLWVAQLYNVFSLRDTNNYEKTIKWRGYDKDGNVWMADNIDLFDDDLILIPAYTTVSENKVNWFMKANIFMTVVVFMIQLVTWWQKGENLRQALKDPEVGLNLSNTFIKEGVAPEPIRLLMISPDDSSRHYHFEIDLEETRELNEPWEPEPGKKRHFFNEQVTHASHMKTEDGQGYIICLSFEEPRVLLLKDDIFKECIDKKDRGA